MTFSKQNIYLSVKDHTVSKETFQLCIDDEYQFLKTIPQPLIEKLPSYYESDDYISHTNSKRSLFEKAYHFIKFFAIKNKLNLILSYVSKKGNLLDIGAGTGDFLINANKKGWCCTGIEPNTNARNFALSKGVKFVNSTEDLKDQSYDVITMWHVLEHVPNLEFQIQELKRLLKPNGIIIIAVPNYKSFDAKFYKQFWAAYDVPRHLWHFSKFSISKLFYNQNIELLKVKPMWFDSFYVSLLSEKYKSGKMNFIKAFCVGFYSNCYGILKKEFSSHIYILKKR